MPLSLTPDRVRIPGAKQPRCGAEVRFAADLEDDLNETTFVCGRERGHDGNHIEVGRHVDALGTYRYRMVWRLDG